MWVSVVTRLYAHVWFATAPEENVWQNIQKESFEVKSLVNFPCLQWSDGEIDIAALLATVTKE